MKILKITFQNLNSLQGTHIIDLENGLLSEAGIFSITGPTGAGKSTILDAITLALFGKAARYDKEANPGEMMTRGTGECAAEILFECNKGRYCAKWTRARARKKPNGKLQSPKREVSKADTGEIIAEKLKEADQMVESLTGLDYHRFLRSVLLAQGRFKEFLDAGDNERGDLLEKITGTEIYSRISQKAYETERAHDAAIQAAQQKLSGVELKTQEQLDDLRQEQITKETEVKALNLKQQTLRTKLQRFEHYRNLQATLEQSNKDLLKWQEADQAFTSSRNQLTQHEATQPFQADLIELEAKQRQHHTLTQAIEALSQIAQQQQTAAKQRLLATLQYVEATLKAQSHKITTVAATQLKIETAEKELTAWLTDNASTRNIEVELPELRALGESVRHTDKALQRTQSELAVLAKDQLANEQALATKKASINAAQQILSKARELVASTAQAVAKEAAGKSVDEWTQMAKAHALADESAKTLSVQHSHWSKAQARLTKLKERHPPLLEQFASAKQARNAHAASVAKETTILEDKQKIYDQARLIAKLETHRADLKPDQACPLCGSLEHPYVDHLESNEDNDKLAVATQKQVLADAEKALKQAVEVFNRLDEKLKSLELDITKATQDLDEQAATVAAAAKAAGYHDALENDDAFSRWQQSLQERHSATDTKLEQLQRLDRAACEAKEAFATLDAADRVSATQLHNLEQKKVDHSTKHQSLQIEQNNTQEDIDTQLAAFNQKLATHLPPARSPAETRSHTQKLEHQLQAYQRQLDTQTQQRLKLKELAADLKELKQAHTRLSEERAQWQSKLDAHPETTLSNSSLTVPESEAQRRSECQAALDKAQEAAQSLSHKRNDLAEINQAIQTTTHALNARLVNTPFKSIQLLKAARLSDTQLTEISATKDRLKSQHDQLLGRIDQTQNQLKKFAKQEPFSAEAEAPLKAEQTTNEQHLSIHNKRLGEIKLLLELDAKARNSQAELIAQIERLSKEARPWIELNALIGSASGDKFSKFAQGLTLAQLLHLANKHLLQLNDRYYIQQTQESELSLEIVDRYQADAIRPTRSLSGGESFLVSLALALGLSDLAGSDTKIESLFIDEGFGTLDTDTLDMALAALENLRMSNRTIGIISHVEALKHRISAQIRITKSSSGHGTLEIINGV
ncbi:AAA family ATPase [Coraliomargarita algicola]|uniref:AAA family ATPase n=1 Tax=Coraliomargarita algicola TaxID=3092156 RepID=A0ABZ0RHE7_9BACT|nr:AAA family ATPase [Coraliomargarita sp. J2-16]WPJ94962.1 AAA family ATPase [Coraliomargarita sp. J2-16]